MLRKEKDPLVEVLGVDKDKEEERKKKKKKKKKTKNGRPRMNGIFTWWIEITACFIALVSLFAIVATLYPHQGRPLPEWPFGISINTLLSIYSFVMKAAMPMVVSSTLCQLQWSWFSVKRPLIDVVRYDSAAKGFLGSVQWLWAHHISQPLTALGAFITIVSIIIDPFIQQLIVYEDCVTALGTNATLPRTNYLESTGLHVSVMEQTISPEIQSAIEAGLFGSPQSIEADCSTGNCTFPQQYATLGYCSACEDITNLVEVAIDYAGNNTDTVTYKDNITTTLPSGLSTSWYGLEGAVFAGMTVNNTEVQLLQGATMFSANGIDPTTGANVTGCNNTVEEKTLWKCRMANAASCKFHPCIRVYNASVSAGKLTETMVESSGVDLEWGNSVTHVLDSIVDTQCTSSSENASLAQLGYDLNSRWIPYNSTLSAITVSNYSLSYPIDSPFPFSLYAHQCVYTISPFFRRSLWEEFLSQIMDGNLTSRVTADVTLNDISGLLTLQVLFNDSVTNLELIQSAFQNVSESFTNYIRLNGAVNQSTPVTGEVLHYATCLNAQWPWIALPASLVMCTCVLLVFTMIKVHSDTIPVWKSTILPILFNGPGLIPEHSLATEDSMAKEAAKIHVVVNRFEGKGFQLVRASKNPGPANFI